MTLKTMIDALNSVDRKTLEYAAENNIAQFVKTGSNTYIGVFAERVPNLTVNNTVGVWSYGTIKQ